MILVFPLLFLSGSEVLVMVGSLLFFYQEAPRRAQAIFVSFVFVSRYCGSLLFYVLLPLLNSLSQMKATETITHYEIPMVVMIMLVLLVMVVHFSYAKNYTYVTERELDAECEMLKPDRILHPTLIRFDPYKKYYMMKMIN